MAGAVCPLSPAPLPGVSRCTGVVCANKGQEVEGINRIAARILGCKMLILVFIVFAGSHRLTTTAPNAQPSFLSVMDVP